MLEYENLYKLPTPLYVFVLDYLFFLAICLWISQDSAQ